MNICIVGGGNSGTALAADLGQKHSVTILTSRPREWKTEVSLIDRISGRETTSGLSGISDSAAELIPQAQMVFLAVPSTLREAKAKEIAPYLAEEAIVSVIPGTGGIEFLCRAITERGITLCGFERHLFVARVSEYGRCVTAVKKTKARAATVPPQKAAETCAMMTELLEVPCSHKNNILEVTLTPSASVLHTVRLYELFKDFGEGDYLPENVPFYAGWGDVSSELMLACDDELAGVCAMLDKINLDGVILNRNYYRAKTVREMTARISGNPLTRNLLSPMIQSEKGFYPDYSSRYFTEDFPYGLCTLKGFASLCRVNTPVMDKMVRWYERLYGLELFCGAEFTGKDIALTSAPQRFGLRSVEDVYAYYGV